MDDLHDPVLATLVQYSNAFGLELDVILTLDGRLVGGTMVSAERFFDSLASLAEGVFDESGDDERRAAGSETLANLFRGLEGQLKDWGQAFTSEDTVDFADPLPEVAHVHLLEAYTVIGGKTVSVGAYRCRLAHVSGWTLGYFE